MASKILHALEADEFFPVFQPLVEFRTGQLAGFEVLARWQSSYSGLVMPDEFIPALEQAGLIAHLTRNLLDKAFDAFSAVERPVMLSINLSPMQLLDFALPANLETLARARNFPLDRLTLEITESALLEDLPRTTAVVQDLKSLRCDLALDDFGTGYSSLRHLHALPFDKLKVDKGFVRSMHDDRESRKIVASVVGLGQSLGLMTVAEGVETAQHAGMLGWLGCDLGQGWLFGHPVPACDLPAILAHPGWDCSAPAYQGPDGLSLFSGDSIPAHRVAQLQAIYDGAPVGLCLFDRDLRYVNINRELAEIHNIPAVAHIGRSIREIIPYNFPVIEPHIRRALQGEATKGVEVTYPPTPRRPQPQMMMLSYQPVHDEAGEVLGVSVALMDVTDRKRAEEALRQTEEHYRHWISFTPYAMWVLDGNGAVVDAGPRWTEFTGQPMNESMGDGWLRMLHPDDVEPTSQAIRHSVETRHPIDTRYRIRRPGEDWIWVRARGSPRLDSEGRIIAIYGIIEPVVDPNPPGPERAVYETRIDGALDTMSVGMVLADGSDGVIFKVNSRAHEILGDGVFPGQTLDQYDRMGLLDENCRPFSTEGHPLARSIQRGDRLESLSALCRHRDGLLTRLVVSSRPIFSSENKIVGGMMVIREADGKTAG
jgi:PAS domain S-box-containing protein